MTAARSYQVALEAVYEPAPKAHGYNLAVEVISNTGAGVPPLVGNPAVVQTFLSEVVYTPAAQVRAYNVAAEVVSRSGQGRNPLPEPTPAIIDHFVAEVVTSTVPATHLDQLVVEAISRSGLGREPLRNNPAVIETFLVEVVSFGTPPLPGEPGSPTDGCDCVITPDLPPVKYLMRRPGRFK